MPETTNPAVLAAGFLNTDALSGEIRGVLFVAVLVLAGYMIIQAIRGDIRQAVIRLGIVVVAVIVVGLAGAVLINPEASKDITETVINVDPTPR